MFSIEKLCGTIIKTGNVFMLPDNTEYFFAQAISSEERMIMKMILISVITKI